MSAYPTSRPNQPVGYRAKRLLDIVVAATGALLSAPVIAFAGLAIILESGRPILFRQERVGLGEERFTVYKLRTMTVEQRAPSQTYNTSPGVTRVGRVLRASKVDELPQLWNVLRGDMSLVGPRPCLPETWRNLSTADRQRFLARPGLTGLAQINGNVSLPWRVRIAYDRAYVESVNFRTDVAILCRTVSVMIGGRA